MTPYRKPLHPLVQRMAEDMTIRNLSPRTIDAYTWHVDKFCQHFGKQPDQLGPEEIRQYQLYLVHDKKASWSSFNQAVCGLRFLYQVTLRRPYAVEHIPFGKKPKKLPTVLGDEEVTGLLACLRNHKYRSVLTACYAAGRRFSEATHLKAEHLDSQRMQIRVHGKGNKERLVPLSPRLLKELRAYWKATRPCNYLFPGRTPDAPLSGTMIQKACKQAAANAKINKVVTPHTLRHSFATALLEAGVDLLTIGSLLGHKSFTTTMIYLHVRRPHLGRSPSPLDWLPIRQCPKWVDPQSPTETNNNLDNNQPDCE